jgi:hypothetical protein
MDESPVIHMDAGFFMDEPAGPQPRAKKMSTVVLNMRNLTDAEIIQRAKELQAGMTGNANFPDPDPTTAAYGTLITTAETKMTVNVNGS